MRYRFIFLFAIGLGLAGCSHPSQSTMSTSSSQSTATHSVQSPEATVNRTNRTFPGILPDAERLNQQVTITMANGDQIVIQLFGDEAPKTVSNFIALAKDHFYDGLTFHRVEPGFVVQGGDPNGNGTGGPGYKFDDEKVTRDYTRGIVAMANSGPNTNGSQFFIMLADTPLPKQYTIFAQVTKGMDAVDKIKVGDVMKTVLISPKAS